MSFRVTSGGQIKGKGGYGESWNSKTEQEELEEALFGGA